MAKNFSKTLTTTAHLINVALMAPNVPVAEKLVNDLQKYDPDWMDQFHGHALVGADLGYRQHIGLVPVSEYVALRAGEGRRLRDARRFNGADPRFVNGTPFNK